MKKTRVKRIGKRIRINRELLGYTQSTFAVVCNLHINTVSNLERGVFGSVRLSTLEAIAKRLKMKVEDLIK